MADAAEQLRPPSKAGRVQPIALEDGLCDNLDRPARRRKRDAALHAARVALPVVEAALVGLPRTATTLACQCAILSCYSAEACGAALGGGDLGPLAVAAASWAALFLAPGLAALRAARVVGVADAVEASSANDDVRRTAAAVRLMSDNFARELTARGHGGLALLLLLALALYVFGAALHTSLGDSGADHFAECSTLGRSMFTALRIPVFDDVGMSFFVETAKAGRLEAFAICCLAVVVVGFGVLSGLIAIFGNGFVVLAADDDDESGESGDETPEGGDGGDAPDEAPGAAAATPAPPPAEKRPSSPRVDSFNSRRRPPPSSRNNLASARRAFPGWAETATPRFNARRRSRAQTMDTSPAGRRGRRGSRGDVDVQIAMLHAKLDALIAAHAAQTPPRDPPGRPPPAARRALPTLPSGISKTAFSPIEASPDVPERALDEPETSPVYAMA